MAFIGSMPTVRAVMVGIGEAIVQAGNRDPVPVRLDGYDLEKTITDEELRQRQQKTWNALSVEPRQTTPVFEQAIGDDTDSLADTADDPDSVIDVSEEADRLLRDIVEHPFTPVTERYEQLSNAYQGNKAKDQLVDAGLVIERQVRTGSHRRKLLELTEKARDYLVRQGIEVERQGRGGIVHRYWQHRVKELFEAAGWPATVELFDADVYVNVGDTELVAEIAMGNDEREVEHVKQHLDTGFDTIWLICRNDEERNGLRERLAEEGVLEDCVVFRTFSEVSNAEIFQLE